MSQDTEHCSLCKEWGHPTKECADLRGCAFQNGHTANYVNHQRLNNRFKCPFCGGNIRQQFPSLRDICEDCGMEVRFDDKNDSPQRMTKTNEWEKRIDYLLKHQENCVIFDEIKREVNYLLTQKDAEVAEALKAVRSAYENGKRDGKAELRKDLASLLHSELDQPNK